MNKLWIKKNTTDMYENIIKEKGLSEDEVLSIVYEWYNNGVYPDTLQDEKGSDLEEICEQLFNEEQQAFKQFYDEPELMTWNKAMEKYENHHKWRLPTKEELIEMTKFNKHSFENDFYWSSSEYGNRGAWAVDFSDGSPSGLYTYLSYRVRVIRAI
jgi:hypothetical protein